MVVSSSAVGAVRMEVTCKSVSVDAQGDSRPKLRNRKLSTNLEIGASLRRPLPVWADTELGDVEVHFAFW